MIRPQTSNPFATRYVRPGALNFRFDPSETNSRACDTSMPRIETLVEQLAHHRTGLLVGHHGSGKSTLLAAMSPHLRSTFAEVHTFQLCRHHSAPLRNWFDQHRISQTVIRQIQASHRNDCLIIDGAEQLGGWRFRRIGSLARKRGIVLLATSHRPIRPFPILHRTSVSKELVEQLTCSLTEQSTPSVRMLVAKRLSQITITDQHNLRDLFFDLYDVVQDQDLEWKRHESRSRPRQTQSD